MSENKIKQSLIDNLASSDWTREKLAEEILIARSQSKRNQAEASWLDQLATHYRDNQGNADYSKQCDTLYAEYQEEVKSIKECYYINN